MTQRKLWCSDYDIYSAESAEEARALRNADNGWKADSRENLEDPIHDEPLDDAKIVTVTYEEPSGAEWARGLSEVRFESRGEVVDLIAPARCFAQRLSGLVSSSPL